MTCCCTGQRESTYTSLADASSLWISKVNTTVLVTVYIAPCSCSGLLPPLKNGSFDTSSRPGVPNGAVRTKKRSEASTLSPQAKWPFSKLIRESHRRLVTVNQQVWCVQNITWPLNHNPGGGGDVCHVCTWKWNNMTQPDCSKDINP